MDNEKKKKAAVEHVIRINAGLYHVQRVFTGSTTASELIIKRMLEGSKSENTHSPCDVQSKYPDN